MVFHSILFESPESRNQSEAPPAFFADLNCDQIVDAITAKREDYNLKPFFYGCLSSIEAIKYRQEVFGDLEHTSLFRRINTFTRKMREVRAQLDCAQKAYYKEQKQAWFLEAIKMYCEAVTSLAADLSNTDLKSRGFLGFRDFLSSYIRSIGFASLSLDTENLKADLSAVRYSVLIKGNSFTVQHYNMEADYSAEINETFEKFKQGTATDYSITLPAADDMNHIEAAILEFVARLHPDVFLALNEFCTRNSTFLNETIAAFDREVQFYIAYLEYAAPLKSAGLHFCYPAISGESKEIYDYGGFDIALAQKLVRGRSAVICNDFYMKGKERILVISGPNQGGKTTFARAFGQLHYLASLGCPVPGREARLLLFDELFTHFEREEKAGSLRGKLEDDLFRIHDILARATSRSIIIMNEIFTSATLQDEIFLSTKVMTKLIELGLLCVWVTFVDELASFGPQTVSMVSTVVPEDPALRTFKILRRPADGLAYAMAIARKYRLTYECIKERIKT
jgi:DNA mismatch repair ATPase MutS